MKLQYLPKTEDVRLLINYKFIPKINCSFNVALSKLTCRYIYNMYEFKMKKNFFNI